jgi:hypothetical protein
MLHLQGSPLRFKMLMTRLPIEREAEVCADQARETL